MISAVPTVIITGFLGVGKSSAILHLLKHKPRSERWAILVNEFGEIGVDGYLLKAQQAKQQQVFIREVPGGCMCCTAGLPMQVALNQLLKIAKPDRLLIEPTGLGHPKEVLQTLTTPPYRDSIDLQNIITLVDARKLADSRYTSHATFNQQIDIADIIVGNKQDLYQSGDAEALKAYMNERNKHNSPLIFTTGGDISALDLNGETATSVPLAGHHHDNADSQTVSDRAIPACGYVKAVNSGEGFHSMGWRFGKDQQFDYAQLKTFLQGINAERMKAVINTNKGSFAYNLSHDGLSENPITTCNESRIEIIATQIDTQWEAQLMACLPAIE